MTFLAHGLFICDRPEDQTASSGVTTVIGTVGILPGILGSCLQVVGWRNNTLELGGDNSVTIRWGKKSGSTWSSPMVIRPGR